MNQLVWHLRRVGRPVYQNAIRLLHHPKRIVFDEQPDPPSDFSGTWELYWPNGRINFRANIVEGQYHGEYICFHRDGSIYQSGQMKQGKCYGRWDDFSEMGWHYKTTNYHGDGSFDVIFYWPSGDPMTTVRYDTSRVEIESIEHPKPENGGINIVFDD